MKKPLLFLLTLAMCLLLTGCFVKTADELYTLPKQTGDYYSLHTAISQIVTGEVQYASPISGTYQQPVQMADLTGDGVDEAIVFAKTTGQKPLKTYIFERHSDVYENICVIEGDGSAFARADYAQIDGEGGMEIIICRQVSSEVPQSISVYSLKDGQPNELMSANYTEYTIVDLDGDEKKDLFLLHMDAEAKSYAELYRCGDSTMEREPEAPLSAGVTAVKQLLSGNLSADCRAVFVGGILEDGSAVTDLYTFRDGTFSHISSLADLGLQSPVVRGYNVFAADVDSDGRVELPDVVRLTPRDPAETEDLFSAIRWFNYDPATGLQPKQTTYHNYASGWFLTMPEQLGVKFAVDRGHEVAGVKGLVFYTCSRNVIGDELFTIYAFTGNNRSTLAESEDRFPLDTKGETAYAASLGSAAQNYGITRETLTEMFRSIRVDWNSGET